MKHECANVSTGKATAIVINAETQEPALKPVEKSPEELYHIC